MTEYTDTNQMSDERFDMLVVSSFPGPIATGYKKMLEATTSESRVYQALYVFDISQRLITYILLSQYLIYDIYEVNDLKVNDLLKSKLPALTLNGWTDVLFTILTAYEEKQHLFIIPELYSFYSNTSQTSISGRKEKESNFRQVVLIRNTLVHAIGPQNAQEWEELEKDLLSRLREILRNCSFLVNYDLIQIVDARPAGESEYRLYRGQEVLARSESLLSDNWHLLSLGEFYLLRADKFAFQLHPFVLHWEGKLEPNPQMLEDIAFFDMLTTKSVQYVMTNYPRIERVIDENFIVQFWRLISREPQPSITITLAPNTQTSRRLVLDTTYLEVVLSPYIKAMTQFQHVVDEIQGKVPHLVRIRAITQNSPISVSLEGAKEASDAIKDVVVPWRREHAKVIAKLDEQERISQIEKLKAENLERRASAQKNRAEAIKLQAEAAKAKAEAEKLSLENEKLRLELHESRINLAIRVLNNLASELSETQRIVYIMKLIEPLGVLTDTKSPLPIADANNQISSSEI